MNRIILQGRFTDAPDLRYTPSGVAVAKFTIAVQRSYKNQNGEYISSLASRGGEPENLSPCVMKTYATLVNAPKWLKLREAAGREIAHRALDDCMATLEVVKKAYKPEFTELDYYRVKVHEEYQYTERAINRITIELEVLFQRLRELLNDRQKYLTLLLDDHRLEEYVAEIAATKEDSEDPFDDDDQPIDISKDNLPF